MTPARKFIAEGFGTMLLLAAIVGSGIMGERLSGGNVAVALLANTIATGAMLVAIIFAFGRISGGHFNPVVTLAIASQGGLGWGEVPGYVLAQIIGALAGVAAAHVMFGEILFSASQHARAGGAQLFSELVATFGLLSVIWGCGRAPGSGTVCRGSLHHRGLLVHGIDRLRQSGRDAGQIPDEHLFRHSSR